MIAIQLFFFYLGKPIQQMGAIAILYFLPLFDKGGEQLLLNLWTLLWIIQLSPGLMIPSENSIKRCDIALSSIFH